VPDTLRIGFLANPSGYSMQLFAQSVGVGARTRGITMVTEEATTREELASALDRLGKQGARAIHRRGERAVPGQSRAYCATRARRAPGPASVSDRRRRHTGDCDPSPSSAL
jgi:hypothetical protein